MSSDKSSGAVRYAIWGLAHGIYETVPEAAFYLKLTQEEQTEILILWAEWA